MTDATYQPGQHPDLPPPINTTGIVGWMRGNLFSSWLNVLLTILGYLPGIIHALWVILRH